MRPTYKKTILILLDTLLFAYVIAAMVSFNKPDESKKVCSEVNIQIADQNANGFLTASEVKKILKDNRMYPLKEKMTDIRPRQIEDLLSQSPFVRTAECYKTQDNHVYISITQRLPIIRIKSEKGEDYYLDDKGGIMPNSKYTSDLIIATGNISKSFAKNYITPMACVIMGNDLWKNMIEQINVLPDLGIEIVPRVGDHVVYLGNLPMTKNAKNRQTLICEYITHKLTRLEKFYKYGLSQVGWNKYPYINLEFNNQIICKRGQEEKEKPSEPVQSAEPAKQENQASDAKQEKTPSEKQEKEKQKEPKADQQKQGTKKDKEKADTEKKKAKPSESKTPTKKKEPSKKDSKQKNGNAEKDKNAKPKKKTQS